MIEVLDRKLIGTGEHRRTLHFQLPAKWVWMQKMKKGDSIFLVLTKNSITAFKTAGEAESFAKKLEQIE